ncbi:MAG TPA: hypothetical protein VFE98_00640 [Candidatus Bathyarchaeia archaeon]|nr:hypothetical protein [Candidatus Bathyarchaeia archaeon]
MHEATFGARIRLPIHDAFQRNNSTDLLVQLGSGYQIVTEMHNATTITPVCSYGDVAAYTVLELVLENNQSLAQDRMNCLNNMYDGMGIADNAYRLQAQQ